MPPSTDSNNSAFPPLLASATLSNVRLHVVPPPVAAVLIDIYPGNDQAGFNQNGHGAIEVAVLGNATFDPTTIDASTLDFSGLSVAVKGSGQVQCDIDDVDTDGY